MDDLLDNMYITNVERRLRDLNNPSITDKKRWIWELIQNAKDTISKNPNRSSIDVCIDVNGDMVMFRHNGDPFTAKSRLGLLYKYSDGKESQESTGRFGTGFLTTHCLSKIVTIESNMYSDKEQKNLCGFQVTMYRDGIVKSELLDGLKKMRQTEKFYEELYDWTTFTYHVNSESGREAIKLGVENFHENIAPTMLFCQELNSVVLNDNGQVTTIIRKPIQTLADNIFLAEFEMTGEKACTRRFLYTHFEDYNDKLSARYKAERSIRLDIAVEIDDNNCLVNHKGRPSHFCVFPLVGIENQLSEPIIINSPDFEPDSERQSLLLNGADWNEEKNIITETGINRIIYANIFPLFDRIVSFLSSNKYGDLYYLAYGLGKVIGKNNNLDEEWYENNVINLYRKVLLDYPVVKAYRGERMLQLSESIIVKDTKEAEPLLYNLLSSLYPSKLAVNNHEWATYIWKDQLRVWNTEDLCKDIENKSNLSNIQLTDKSINNWFNEFLGYVVEYDERFLKDYALLPNMEGSFLKRDEKDFKQGEHITTFIISLVEKLGKNLKPLLLHDTITSVTLEAKYNSQSYSAEVNRLAKSIIDDDSISGSDKVIKLLPLLSIIPNNIEKYKDEEFIRKRKNFYDIFISIHQLKEPAWTIDNSLLESAWKDTDIWFESHILQCLNQFGCLSNLPDELDAHWLNNCLMALNVQTTKLNDFAVLPNQNGYFCKHNDLFKDNHIPKELKDVIFDSVDLKYKNVLLHKDIDAAAFSINQVKDISTFANELKTKFANANNNSVGNLFRNACHYYSQDVLDKIARYMISILPANKESELYEFQVIIYDVSNKILGVDVNFAEHEVCYDTIELWQDSNTYVVNQIAEKISALGSMETLCEMLGNGGEKYAFELLNKFYKFISHNNIKYSSLSVFPNQNGLFRPLNDVKKEDGYIDSILKDIISLLVAEEEDYRNILIDKNCYLQPQSAITIKEAYSLIDDNVSEYYKRKDDECFVKAVHLFLEKYKHVTQDNFPKSFPIKDTILIEVVWPQEKREKLMKISEQLSDEQIETLLENDAKIEELTNKVNQLENMISQLSVIQEIENKYPDFDFSFVLNLLETEEGQFGLRQVEHDISYERRLEIGDEGECFVYDMLCNKFGTENVLWSNHADENNFDIIRVFNGRIYYIKRTSHDYDFKVSYNNIDYYFEVKTTVSSVKRCSEFPLFFQTKEWEWIDNNTDRSCHYIIRVFDVEKNPKAYFLKQMLDVE